MSKDTISASEAFEKIAKAANGAGEQSARQIVMRGLATAGYRSAPRIIESKADGANVRIYHWSNTPLGDLLLVAGGRIESRLIHGSDLTDTPKAGAIYIEATAAPDKVAAKVAEYLRSKAVERPLREAQAAGASTRRATSPTPRAAAGKGKESKPKVEVKEAGATHRFVSPGGADARMSEVWESSRGPSAAVDRYEREQRLADAARRKAIQAGDTRRGEARERYRGKVAEREAEAARQSSRASEMAELKAGLGDLAAMLGI